MSISKELVCNGSKIDGIGTRLPSFLSSSQWIVETITDGFMFL